MRRLLSFTAVAAIVLILIGAAVAFGVHLAAAGNGMTVTVNGETLEGPVVAALLGGTAASGVAVLVLLAVAVLASVAIIVPVVLLLVALGVLAALFVGLSPILVPVLLLVGAYVLLSRRRRRRAVVDAAAYPPPTAT